MADWSENMSKEQRYLKNTYPMPRFSGKRNEEEKAATSSEGYS